MTPRTLGLTDPLHDYLLQVGFREHPALKRVREETSKVPGVNAALRQAQSERAGQGFAGDGEASPTLGCFFSKFGCGRGLTPRLRANEGLEIGHARTFVGGNDQAELMRILLRPIEECAGIHGITSRPIETARCAVAGHAITDDVFHVRPDRGRGLAQPAGHESFSMASVAEHQQDQ